MMWSTNAFNFKLNNIKIYIQKVHKRESWRFWEKQDRKNMSCWISFFASLRHLTIDTTMAGVSRNDCYSFSFHCRLTLRYFKLIERKLSFFSAHVDIIGNLKFLNHAMHILEYDTSPVISFTLNRMWNLSNTSIYP